MIWLWKLAQKPNKIQKWVMAKFLIIKKTFKHSNLDTFYILSLNPSKSFWKISFPTLHIMIIITVFLNQSRVNCNWCVVLLASKRSWNVVNEKYFQIPLKIFENPFKKYLKQKNKCNNKWSGQRMLSAMHQQSQLQVQ